MRIVLKMLVIILFAGVNPYSQAFELAAGVAGVDEGDDRYRPASSLHLGFNESCFLRSYLYGRELGPYKETTSVLSLNYRFPILGKGSNVLASVGGTSLLERIEYDAHTEGEKDESKNQFNFGTAFGVSYRLPFKSLYVSLDWDAHLYLAGSSGLLLVTGRKQMIGLSLGVRL